MSANYFQKAIEIIPKTSFVLSEFLAMLAEIKPAVVTSLQNNNDLELIKKNFPNLFFSLKDGKWYKKNRILAISRKKINAEKASDYLGLKLSDQGKVLGYPDCCSKKIEFLSINNKAIEPCFGVYSASQGIKKCNYLLNNIFNFYSRMGKEKHNFINLDKYHKINSFFFSFSPWNLQYIPHIPCSYKCKKSILFGKKIEGILKIYAPNIEKIIKYTLSKPVLFFNTFKAIVFDGHVVNDKIFYKKIIPPFFTLVIPFQESILKGNIMKITKNNIYIYADNKILFTYNKEKESDGFILNFI